MSPCLDYYIFGGCTGLTADYKITVCHLNRMMSESSTILRGQLHVRAYFSQVRSWSVRFSSSFLELPDFSIRFSIVMIYNLGLRSFWFFFSILEFQIVIINMRIIHIRKILSNLFSFCSDLRFGSAVWWPNERLLQKVQAVPLVFSSVQ